MPYIGVSSLASQMITKRQQRKMRNQNKPMRIKPLWTIRKRNDDTNLINLFYVLCNFSIFIYIYILEIRLIVFFNKNNKIIYNICICKSIKLLYDKEILYKSFVLFFQINFINFRINILKLSSKLKKEIIALTN